MEYVSLQAVMIGRTQQDLTGFNVLYLQVSSLPDPFILPPDSEWYYPFSVQFLPSSSDCLFNTSLRLYTNSTYFTIPLHCYDGRVKVNARVVLRGIQTSPGWS